jgi:LysM repeat protein
MSIKHVAAAVIAPTAIAGIALSTGATASAAPVHYAAHHSPRQARHHRQHQQGQHPYQWVTVQAGDTLSRIAAAHHMSWEALYATFPNYHRVADPDMIRAGQHLRLPKDPALRASQFPALAARLRASMAPEHAPAASVVPAAQPAGQPAPDQPASGQDEAGTGQQAQASAQSSGGGSSTGGMSSFEQCVAYRESSDTPTDPDGLFGILPSTWASLGYSGTAGEASVSVQKEAFSRLYAEDGTSPWAPYDGC